MSTNNVIHALINVNLYIFFQESVESESFVKLFQVLQKLKNPTDDVRSEATGSITTTECMHDTEVVVHQDGQNQILQDIPVGLMDIPVILEQDLVNNPEITVIHDLAAEPHSSAAEETSPAANVVTPDQPLVSTGTSGVSDLENDDSAHMVIDRSGTDEDFFMETENFLDVQIETEISDLNNSDMEAETGIKDLDISTKENQVIHNVIGEDEVLDLSLPTTKTYRPLSSFFQRPPTPKRKGKKFAEKSIYAVNSREFKMREERKIHAKKMELQRKEAKKLEIVEKKRIAEKEKEAKRLIRLRKKEETENTKLINKTLMTLKKEKIDEKENPQKIKAKRSTKAKKQPLKQSVNAQKA